MHQPLLQVLHPEQVEVAICRSEELDRRSGLTSELDEMWSDVRRKAYPRWPWHAIGLLLDSRIVYVPMAYNPTFVMFSSLKPLFFNSLKNESPFSDNARA